MSLSKLEQETIISWNNAEKEAEVYTFDISLINRLDKLIEKGHSINRGEMDNGAKVYNLPKKTIKVVFPRLYTEEQKQKLRDVLAAAREKQKEQG